MHRGRHVSPDTQRRSAERPSPRSPGRERLQPRAFAADRPGTMVAAPPHPLASLCQSSRAGRVRHRLTPTRRGSVPHCRTPIPDRGWVVPPCRGEALPRPPAPHGAAHAGRRPACGDDHDRPLSHAGGGLPALTGRRVRHRLTPTGRGLPPFRGAHVPDRAWVTHVVGARRCLARPRHQARETHGRYRPVAMAKGHCPTDDGCRCRPSRAGRVRHRLIPTTRGQRPNARHDCPTGDGSPHLVGARRCLARRAAGAANAGRHPACGADHDRPPTHAGGLPARGPDVSGAA
jgi:hypothetical protein